jgi:PleD family two-component response regulator
VGGQQQSPGPINITSNKIQAIQCKANMHKKHPICDGKENCHPWKREAPKHIKRIRQSFNRKATVQYAKMATASNCPSKILIVDDTPENLTVLRDILARDGHQVRPVLQGELALKIARMDPPDLILLDVLMPGLNGYETCAQIKADPFTADNPVLFISALDSTTDKLRGFQAGGLDYITKPFHEKAALPCMGLKKRTI